MAKKRSYYTDLELRIIALDALKEKYFGGLSPSDHSSNWNWGPITDQQGHQYGIYLRFGLECFAQSFSELGFYPVFSTKNPEVLMYYKRKEDFTDEELLDLKVDGFLAEFPKYDN